MNELGNGTLQVTFIESPVQTIKYPLDLNLLTPIGLSSDGCVVMKFRRATAVEKETYKLASRKPLLSESLEIPFFIRAVHVAVISREGVIAAFSDATTI